MALLKQIDEKGAVLAWSPKFEYPNLIALGTKDSAGTGFDDHGGELELHKLDFADAFNTKTSVLGSVRASSRFSSIAWSKMANFSNEYSHGLIAGGMIDGTVNIWNPSSIVTGQESLLASLEQHQGAVTALHFNPHKESSHLLATGGSDGEVYIMALDRLDPPTVFLPAPNSVKHTADVTQVSWNSQVAHIIASSAQNGSCFVWDLRQKRAWCELRDPTGGCVADIAWNPDEGLHIITASGDDKNPVLKLWDLRSSTSLPLATLQGHTEGILSISWSQADTSLLLSCGKDNKTFIWDLYQLQPIYELPFKNPVKDEVDNQSVFGGLATSASHRRYNVAWSPCLPAVTSTSSFDRKVQFYSTSGFRSKLGRAPKWLRRPVCATFGFGGKFVVIDNSNVPKQPTNKKNNIPGKINVYQLTENQDLVQASDEFHSRLNNNQFKEICEAKASCSFLESAAVWKLMRVICFGSNAREELLTYLGFDSATISATAASYIANSNTPSNPADASDIFNSDVNSKQHDLSSDFSNLSISQRENFNQLLDIVKAGEQAEPNVRKALVVGNFEMAVECCLRAGLLAEALLLAQCGGQELRVKTQAAFFERQRHVHPFLNVLHAVIKNQLMEFVLASDLQNWKETLALLSTYGKSDEFSSLCEVLANRLETELSDKRSAALCYMCAANVQRTIKYWTEELEEANKSFGQLNTLALEDYVEKVIVFTQANPVEDLGDECGSYFALYADLLASQGRLSSATNYLKGNSLPVRILSDRIYHAGNKPAGSRPPPFPFDKVNLDLVKDRSVENNAKVVDTAATKRQNENINRLANTAQNTTSAGISHSLQATAANNPLSASPLIAQPLPAGWVQLIDPTSNRPYYANQATGQSQWEPPVAPSAGILTTPSTDLADKQSSALGHGISLASKSLEILQETKSQPTIEEKPQAAVVPGPEADCVIALGQMIEAIAAGNLNPAEKKQIVMLRSNYQILSEKLARNEISSDVLLKLSSLTESLCNKNFVLANQIQTDLVNTIWNQHKEWLKGIKILIQLASRK